MRKTSGTAKTIALVPADVRALSWFRKDVHGRVRSAAAECIPSLPHIAELHGRELLTTRSYAAQLTSKALAALAAAGNDEPNTEVRRAG